MAKTYNVGQKTDGSVNKSIKYWNNHNNKDGMFHSTSMKGILVISLKFLKIVVVLPMPIPDLKITMTALVVCNCYIHMFWKVLYVRHIIMMNRSRLESILWESIIKSTSHVSQTGYKSYIEYLEK